MRVLVLGDEQGQLASVLSLPPPPERRRRGQVTPQDVAGYDIGVAYRYRHKVPKSVLDVLHIVNIHTSFLPWNRGAHPNVWPLMDGSPAGVTLHWMDEGIDTGDIIAQREVPIGCTDTAEDLWHRLQSEALLLFKQMWPEIARGTAPRRPQPPGGSVHRKSDLAGLDNLDMSGFELGVLKQLRARTFAGHPAAYYERNGRRVYVRVELSEEPC